jgi:hypothetical protein
MKVGKFAKAVVLVMGILAAIGLYAWKAAEWTRGFQPFLVHGQGSPGGSHETFIDPIIPFMMVGSFDGGATKFSTIIQITSTGSAAAFVSGTFFNSDGTAFPATFRTNQSGLPTFSRTFQLSLAIGSTLAIAADQDAPLLGWGSISVSSNARLGTGNVAITTFLENRNAVTGEVNYRLPVDSTSAGMASFLLPRFSNPAGVDVGFLIVNNGSTTADITATLRNADGMIITTRSLQLRPFNQIGYFVPDFFSIPPESPGPNYTNIVFDSNSTLLSAVALGSGAGPYLTYPVVRLR